MGVEGDQVSGWLEGDGKGVISMSVNKKKKMIKR